MDFRRGMEGVMTCHSCESQEQREFPAEIAIHFPRLENIDKAHVLVSPKLLICPRCGAAEFAVPEAELRTLVNCAGDAGEGK